MRCISNTDVKVPRAGDATVQLHLLPTLNTNGGVDVRVGVSIDDGEMQTMSMRLTPSPDPGKTPEQRNWEQAVIDNNVVLEARFPGIGSGQTRLEGMAPRRQRAATADCREVSMNLSTLDTIND